MSGLFCKAGLHKWESFGINRVDPSTFYEMCRRCGKARGCSIFGGSWPIDPYFEASRLSFMPLNGVGLKITAIARATGGEA